MKNKSLLAVFLVLSGILIYTKLAVPNKDRSFSQDILSIDTSAVVKIDISPKGVNPFQLEKKDGKWNLLQDSLDVEAEESNVTALLSQLSSTKATRIVSRSKNKWQEYEVGDQNGSKIKMTYDNNKVKEIVVGKFIFNQQKKQANTYVRTAKSEDTYLVDGFLSMTVSKEASSYRNQNILSIPSYEALTRITYNHANKDITLRWQRNNEIQNSEDSIAINSYIKQLSNIRGSVFASKKPEAASLEQTLVYTLNDNKPDVTINAYVQNDSMYIIHSTQNPKNYFLCKKDDEYKKTFSDFVNIL